MRTFISLFLTLLIASVPQLDAATFVLHGSFSSEDAWYQKGGKFYTALEQEVAQRGEELQSFSWSGGITSNSIITGSERLVSEILKLHANEPIRLVAHSNGGNVSNFATTLLAALRDNLTPQAPEISTRLYRPFMQSTPTKSGPAIESINTETQAAVDQAYQRLRVQFEKRSLRRTSQESPYMINELYLMGTPINTRQFDVDMSVVKHVFNLYSCNDYVQPLVGEQTLPHHERRSNLHVMLHNPAYKDEPVAPCHKHIRNHLVAKWLLRIKDVVGQELNDGYLILHAHEQPTYQASAPDGHQCEPDDDF